MLLPRCVLPSDVHLPRRPPPLLYTSSRCAPPPRCAAPPEVLLPRYIPSDVPSPQNVFLQMCVSPHALLPRCAFLQACSSPQLCSFSCTPLPDVHLPPDAFFLMCISPDVPLHQPCCFLSPPPAQNHPKNGFSAFFCHSATFVAPKPFDFLITLQLNYSRTGSHSSNSDSFNCIWAKMGVWGGICARGFAHLEAFQSDLSPFFYASVELNFGVFLCPGVLFGNSDIPPT